MQRGQPLTRYMSGSSLGQITLRRTSVRPFHISAARFDKPLSSQDNKTLGKHGGSLARTDGSLLVEHPKENVLPTNGPVRGSGGLHHNRTLATFSLEGQVGVVTGGARGLGSVMSQALVLSGANLAIVDLHRKQVHTQELVCQLVSITYSCIVNRERSRETSRKASRGIQRGEPRGDAVCLPPDHPVLRK